MKERIHGTQNGYRRPTVKRKRGLRVQVKHRDGGVCAQCKLDTEMLINSERERTGKSREDVIAAICWDWGISNGIGEDSRGVVRYTLWIADHIVPLVEGGRDVLGNVQTLCLKCDLDKTIKDVGRASGARHKARRLFGKMGARAKSMRAIREAQFIEESDDEIERETRHAG